MFLFRKKRCSGDAVDRFSRGMVQSANWTCKTDVKCFWEKQSGINTTKATSYNIMGLLDLLGFASKSLS